MTSAPLPVEARVLLSPSRDGRLVPYALVAVGSLSAAMLAGEPALAMLSMPFAVALALGIRRAAPIQVTARIFLDTDQVLEGDLVTGRIELQWRDRYDAQMMLYRPDGMRPASASGLSATRPGVSSIELPIHLEAVGWGRHSVGEIWVRLSLPLGLLVWSGKVLNGPVIRVLPDRERLTRLLDPPESRTVWGAHGSKRIGDGHEFAELRPYAPGDRLRDLNWAATARFRRPFVNRHHPELSADIVVALDAFDDGSRDSTDALARAARAAWALASIHLRANDRVGLMGLRGTTRALAPAGGRLAQYQILDALLRIGGQAAARVMNRGGTTAPPPSALVIVLTPLHDRASIDILRAWRSHGRSVAVVVIDPSDPDGRPVSRAESTAVRLWTLELERRKGELAALGIPVVTAPSDGPITPVVSALRRARLAPFVRRSGR